MVRINFNSLPASPPFSVVAAQLSLRGKLASCGNCFELMRYAYEGCEEGSTNVSNEVSNAVKGAILEIRPDWKYL